MARPAPSRPPTWPHRRTEGNPFFVTELPRLDDPAGLAHRLVPGPSRWRSRRCPTTAARRLWLDPGPGDLLPRTRQLRAVPAHAPGGTPRGPLAGRQRRHRPAARPTGTTVGMTAVPVPGPASVGSSTTNSTPCRAGGEAPLGIGLAGASSTLAMPCRRPAEPVPAWKTEISVAALSIGIGRYGHVRGRKPRPVRGGRNRWPLSPRPSPRLARSGRRNDKSCSHEPPRPRSPACHLAPSATCSGSQPANDRDPQPMGDAMGRSAGPWPA